MTKSFSVCCCCAHVCDARLKPKWYWHSKVISCCFHMKSNSFSIFRRFDGIKREKDRIWDRKDNANTWASDVKKFNVYAWWHSAQPNFCKQSNCMYSFQTFLRLPFLHIFSRSHSISQFLVFCVNYMQKKIFRLIFRMSIISE